MTELISAILMLTGVFFMIVAGVGVLRMPDLFLRMSATTKAATLGVGSILLAVAIYSGELGVISRALATITFLFLTAPIAAHMIGRAAYFVGVPLWSGTICDDLRGSYDPRTHELRSVRLADLERQLPDFQFYQFRVGARSVVVGKTLAEIDLRREYGVTVLAIRRGSSAMYHPDAETQLLADDEIILAGAPDSLEQVTGLFRGPEPGDRGPEPGG